MYVCMCMYSVCIYVHIYMYLYVHVRTYVHCMYMYMYVYLYVLYPAVYYMYMYVYRLYTCNYNSQNILVVVRLIYMKEIPFIFEARVNHCVKRKYNYIKIYIILNV